MDDNVLIIHSLFPKKKEKDYVSTSAHSSFSRVFVYQYFWVCVMRRDLITCGENFPNAFTFVD